MPTERIWFYYTLLRDLPEQSLIVDGDVKGSEPDIHFVVNKPVDEPVQEFLRDFLANWNLFVISNRMDLAIALHMESDELLRIRAEYLHQYRTDPGMTEAERNAQDNHIMELEERINRRDFCRDAVINYCPIPDLPVKKPDPDRKI